jgi:YD repeat-containing protein
LAKSNGPQCPSSPQPIAFATGNKWLVENDLGQGETLAFTRTYNSNPGTLSSSLGASWRIDYGQRLGFNSATGAVWAYRPDGRALQFLVSGSNYVADADVPDRLYRETTVGYRLETDNRTERYDNAGRLTSRTDSQGKTQTFTYDTRGRLATVADHVGRQLVLSYDGQNRISALTDPAGQKITYAYDSANNLGKVTYPDLKFKTYHYNEPANTGGSNLPHALTGITDENGIRYMSYGYDSSGRAIEERSPAAGTNTNHYQLSYNTGSTTVTDPLGSSRTYNFQTVLGVPRATGSDQPAGSGCAAAASATTYDANGNVASRTDFNGKVTTYAYDASRNLETQRVEGGGTPDARTVSSAWHGVWRLPTRVAEPRKLTSYIYNGDLGNGQPVTCAPANATIPMGGANQKIGVLCTQVEQATTDASGASGLSATIDTAVVPRMWSYTYDTVGRVLTRTDPRGGVTTHSYYSTTTFPPEPFDPHMNAVTLLLHGDGLQGATTLSDDSSYHRAVSVFGNAQLSTAQSKFGGTSIALDGAGDYLSVASSVNFDFSGDFCVESWIKPSGVTGVQTIIGRQQLGAVRCSNFG